MRQHAVIFFSQENQLTVLPELTNFILTS